MATMPGTVVALFLNWYRLVFGFPPDIVFFGALVVFASFAAFIVLVSSVSICFSIKPVELLLSLALALLLFVAIYVCLAAYVSNSLWGDTANYWIVATFIRQPLATLGFLPISDVSQKGVLLGVIAVVAANFVLLLWLAHRIVRRIAAEARILRRVSSVRALILTVCAAVATPCFATAAATQFKPASLRGEPFSSFFNLYPETDLAGLDNTRLSVAIQDRAERTSYPRTAPTQKKNVVVIFSDALRADRMGVYGYGRETTPHLSNLLKSGHLHKVDLALSTCSESYCGIASTFSSRPFHEISEHNFKLHELLKDVGYQVLFFLSGDHRAWRYLSGFYGSSVDNIYDMRSFPEKNINDDENLITGLREVSSFQGKPVFFYFFLMSTHVSGRKLPEFERFTPAKLDAAKVLTFWNEIAGTRRVKGKIVEGGLSASDQEAMRNRYDNGVLQTDFYIDRILTILREKGYLNNAIVVILGDHGDGLGEHGHIGHTRFLYQEDIRIPLLVYDTEKVSYANSTFGVQPDIAPTIIDRLGLPIPRGWRGRSLQLPSVDRITLHQTRRGKDICFAAVENDRAGTFKYIRCGLEPGDRREMLFDLKSDPGELTNIIDGAGFARAGRLRAEVESRFPATRNSCKRFECVD